MLLNAHTGQIGLLAHIVVPGEGLLPVVRGNYRLPSERGLVEQDLAFPVGGRRAAALFLADIDATHYRRVGSRAERLTGAAQLFSLHSLQYLLPRKAKPETMRATSSSRQRTRRKFDARAEYY